MHPLATQRAIVNPEREREREREWPFTACVTGDRDG